MEKTPLLGVIGGSGLYHMAGLQQTREFDLDTPFGRPSAPLVVGALGNTRLAFLARHGIGHHISPSEINYRANIYALKMLGVQQVVSISACGSLREDYAPGDTVIPDQLFDFTRGRERSFFGNGMVAHVGVAEPFCGRLSGLLGQAVEASGVRLHCGGAFITIEGPRFSTRAESNTYRAWGMSLIGMTTSPEAFLAREAELCYTVMAHITDYDVWHINEAPVSVEAVIATLNKNTHLAEKSIANLARLLQENENQVRPCDCPSALANALITQPQSIPAETRQRLDLLVGKYLKGA